MYLLIRDGDGKMVAKPGSARSYTSNPGSARLFHSRAEAEANKCENEYAMSVDDLFRGGR